MKTYCFKCRRKVEMKNPELVTLRNGKTMVRGGCSACGTKVLKVPNDKAGIIKPS